MAYLSVELLIPPFLHFTSLLRSRSLSRHATQRSQHHATLLPTNVGRSVAWRNKERLRRWLSFYPIKKNCYCLLWKTQPAKSCVVESECQFYFHSLGKQRREHHCGHGKGQKGSTRPVPGEEVEKQDNSGRRGLSKVERLCRKLLRLTLGIVNRNESSFCDICATGIGCVSRWFRIFVL